MLNYPTGCLWKTLVKFAIMKKIVSTILIAIVVCLSMSGQDNLEGIYKIDVGNGVGDTGNFYIEDSKLSKEQVAALLKKDVIGYFDLYDEYPTELKQSVFKKSEEYANYLARLEEDYAFLMSSEYRIDYNLKYNKSYDCIETHIRRDILKAWKETDPFIWKEELNYNERPTVKRIITLLLEQFDY